MRKSVGKKLIILFAALCILVVFACVSVSKFVLSDQKELVGVYTDFVLSHDGDGQTAVVKSETDGSSTGYIVTTVSNFTEKEVSKRDIRFSLRVPTSEEIAAGHVTDAWGAEHTISETSKYYDVSIVDENDNELTGTSDATLLKADIRNSSSLLIKIKRKAGADKALADDATEHVSIVLQTSVPYKDLQVFTINTTMARLSVGVSSDVYQGFTREIVNLKSATEFIRANSERVEGVSYLAAVEFTLSGDVAFDAARYEESYGYKPVFSDDRSKVVIIIHAGADVNLYFYASGTCNVKISATIDDGLTAEGAERVSGVGEDKVVFAR